MRAFLNHFVRITATKRSCSSASVVMLLMVFIFFNISVLMKQRNNHNIVISDENGVILDSGESSADTVDNTHTIFDSSPHQSYLTGVFKALIDVEPDFNALPSEYPKAPEMAPWDDHPVLSYNFLSSSYLKVENSQVESLKKSHKRFYDMVKNKSSPLHFANHVRDTGDIHESFYIPDSSGIVYVGGGKYSWFALLSIKHLRHLGSKLPVEVYIPTEEEYEAQFCEKVLPELNAKCLKMYEILDLEVIKSSNFEIKGFMLKSLALMLSNFENILLLDADNVPYLNPDILFVSEPYLNHNFVLWPDYWARTTHPKMFEIQGLDIIGENLKLEDDIGRPKYKSKEQLLNDVPLHDLEGTPPDPSCETGQLMISKKTHADVVLLSLYYNVYGPRYFYHLITQWAPGQGDKDTFIVAANLLNSTFYQVKTTVRPIGYHKKNGEFRGTAQGQYNPIDELAFTKYHSRLLAMYEKDFCLQNGITSYQLKDSKIYQDRLKEYQKAEIDNIKIFTDEKDEDKALKEYFAQVFDLKIKLMFVHESTPKFDPLDLILNNQITEDQDHRIRFYDDVLNVPGYYQFEKMQWENIHEMLCGEEKGRVKMEFIEKQKKEFGEKYDEKKFCEEIKKEIQWMSGSGGD